MKNRECIELLEFRIACVHIRGQPSIYLPIGDHVNVSWCRSHTNASGFIATSHIVASHSIKLLLSFRQISCTILFSRKSTREDPLQKEVKT